MTLQRNAAIFRPSLQYGGSERLILQLADALQEAGWRVTFWLNEGDRRRGFNASSGHEIRVVRSRLPKTLGGLFRIYCSWLRMLRVTAQVQKQTDMDLIVVDLVPHLIPHLKKRWPGVPVLCYCHFPDKLLTRRKRNWWYRCYRQYPDRLEQRGLQMADELLVNSEFTMRCLFSVYPELKANGATVVHPCIDASAIRSRQECGQDILSLGRIHHSKNHSLSMRAFAASNLPVEVRLLVAGGLDVDDRECVAEKYRLTRLALELGIDQRTDWLFDLDDDAMEEVWRRARVVVHPPVAEHFGIVLLEAMARGIPVVAVEHGGPTEIVVDRVTGLLVPPDPTLMGTALNSIWSRPQLCQEMSQASHDRVRRVFAISQFQAQIQAAAMNCQVLHDH